MPKGRKFKTKQELIDAVISQRSSRKSFGFGSSDSLQSDLDIIENLTDGEFENASGFVDTTYSELVNDINTSSLSKGVWYGFDYQTIHYIPGTTELNSESVRYDPGNGEIYNFTPEVEKLYVLALDVNKIHTVAVSPSYPDDIIHYDYQRNLAPLSGGGGTARNGFITYRKDTVNNIEAGFDFRNTIVRRNHFNWAYKDDGATQTAINIYFKNNTLTTQISTGYTDVYGIPLSYNGVTNTSTVETIDNPTDAADVDSAGNPTENSNFPTLYPVGELNVGGFEAAQAAVQGGAESYRDFKVITKCVVPGIVAGTFKNISIGVINNLRDVDGSASGLGNDAITSSNLDSVPDLLIRSVDAYDITIGNNCNKITLNAESFNTITLGNSNDNIYIGDTAIEQISAKYKLFTRSRSQQISIGDFNQDIAISEHSWDIKIGNHNSKFWNLQGSSNIKIGDRNTNIYNYYSFHNTIGDQNTDLYFSMASNVSIKDHNTDVFIRNISNDTRMGEGLNIGSLNTTVRIGKLGSANTSGKIGDKNNNVWVASCERFTLEDELNTILLEISPRSIIERGGSNIYIQGRSIGGNIIGADSSNIQISDGAYNKIGKNCTNILLGYGAVVSNLDFIEIGDTCTDIYIIDSTLVKIGVEGSNNFIRSSEEVTFGHNCSGNFVEGSNGVTLGNFCIDNTFSDTGLRFMSPISDLDSIIYIAGRTEFDIGGGTKARERYDAIILSVSNSPGVIADPSVPSGANTLGDRCSYNIFLNGAINNVLGNEVNNCVFGASSTNTTAGITYNHVWGNAKDTGAINLILINGAADCKNNVIKDRVSYVSLAVASSSDNKINARINADSTILQNSLITYIDPQVSTVPVAGIVGKTVSVLSQAGDLYYEDVDYEVDLTIATGGVLEAESFSVNGVTFTEPTDFNAIQDLTADATAIAGIDYSAIPGLVVTNPSAGVVRFTFASSYDASGLTNGSFALSPNGIGNPKLVKIA